MDIEELKKALKSDEGKELLNSLIEVAKKPILDKNQELMDEVKKQKKEKSDFAERLESLEAEKTAAEEKIAAKTGDVSKLKEQLEAKHKKEIDALAAEKTRLEGQLQSHVIGEGLTAALVKAKVAPALMDAAKALIKTNFKGEVGDADGKPFAKFDGKNVDEFVTGWAQSDAGKAFVLANSNSGGGSNGANGNGGAGTDKKTMTRTEFGALSPAEKSKAAKEGVALTDA